MASGIQSAVRILTGDTEKLTVFDSYVNDQKLEDVLKNYFMSVKAEEQVVMVSDLYGGSVNSVMYRFLERKNTYLVSGVNLIFILELLMKEQVNEKTLQTMIEESCQMFKLVSIQDTEQEKNSIADKKEAVFF